MVLLMDRNPYHTAENFKIVYDHIAYIPYIYLVFTKLYAYIAHMPYVGKFPPTARCEQAGQPSGLASR